MTLFNFRYRVEPARLPKWDYHSPGWYFVTICTRNKTHYFGSVINHRMILSPVGEIAGFELLRTSQIRDNVAIDAWVIMPDHIHVIIRILSPQNVPVETHRGASLPTGPPAGGKKNAFGPQSDNLPSIVRGFKSAVKRQTNLDGLEFHWQARYHDRIIRDDKGLHQIREYIRQNLNKWG